MPVHLFIISGLVLGIQRKDYDNEGGKEDIESEILFDLVVIINATNNFSNDNKLGEGGFGPVYKVNNNITS